MSDGGWEEVGPATASKDGWEEVAPAHSYLQDAWDTLKNSVDFSKEPKQSLQDIRNEAMTKMGYTGQSPTIDLSDLASKEPTQSFKDIGNEGVAKVNDASKQISDTSIGAGQAAAAATASATNFGLAIPPALMNSLNDITQGKSPHFLDDFQNMVQNRSLNYIPDTEKGQEYTDYINELYNRYGVAILPMLHGLIPSIPDNARIKPKAAPVSNIRIAGKDADIPQPSSRIDQIMQDAANAGKTQAGGEPINPATTAPAPLDVQGDVARLHDQAIQQRLQELNDQVSSHEDATAQNQASAQDVIDARQRELELNVKRQQTLDFNAAERARQENAPLPSDMAAEASRQQDEANMPHYAFNQKMQDLKQQMDELQSQMDKSRQEQMSREAQARSQAAIEQRQAQMQQDVARQQSLDYNAAERARQEAAPLPSSMAAEASRQLDQQNMPAYTFNQRIRDLTQQVNDLQGQMDRAKQEGASAEAQANAQQLLNQRQAQLEFEVKKQQTLDFNSQERARQGNAPVPGDKSNQLPPELRGPTDLRTGFSKDDLMRAWNMTSESMRRFLGEDDGSLTIGQSGMNASAIPPEGRQTPEQIQTRLREKRFVDRFPGNREKLLDEFGQIKTKEEALALSNDAKDISPDFGQKQLGSGINFHTIMSNNPFLKFARTSLFEARNAANRFSQKFITDKTGLSPTWEKMKPQERVEVMNALMSGDKHQLEVSDALMDRMGFSDKQRQFIKTFYDADKQLYADWQDSLRKVGLKVPDSRTGHFPGIFTGAYKTLIVKSVELENGKVKNIPIGVIATDTRAEHAVALDEMKKRAGEGVKFIQQDRNGLTGVANRYYSDIFSGMSDVLDMLGKEDPHFQAIQDLVSNAVRRGNNSLFNFNVHELAKKGIVGNEGNKPWLTPERNANDAFKALVRYFEEGAEHHALQAPLKDLHDMLNDPALDHMSNAKAYVDNYIKKVTGRDLNPLGAAINTILDTPWKFMPTISWKSGDGVGTALTTSKVRLGVGPSIPLKIAGKIRNNMSQLFMGWGNYMFTVSQLVQPAQTGLPFVWLAANRLGLHPGHVPASMLKGGTDFIRALTEDFTGKAMDSLDQHMRAAYQYAKDHGLLNFSEMERAYEGTQSKLGRVKDKVAEASMQFGEFGTRTPMFLGFVDLLTKGGIAPDKAYPIAENLTNFSMVDYHPWERPMLYSKYGVLGGFAGGLTTFKHGLVSQQVKLGKELVVPTMIDGARANRQGLPLAYSMSALVALAGLTGLPFYNELDKLYRHMTNSIGGEARSIRESFLSNMPEWLNSGVVSNATNLNIQSKFSSADMLPDSAARAASPHLEGFAKIIGDAIDMAKSGADAVSVRNFLVDATPAGWRRATENIVARGPNYIERDDPTKTVKADLIGHDGETAVRRTVEEWKRAALTGARPQQEAVEREMTWNERLKQKADQDRQKEIEKEYKQAILSGTIAKKGDPLMTEYQARKGDPMKLKNIEIQTDTERDMTQKERLQGIPRNLNGANRFNYFNK